MSNNLIQQIAPGSKMILGEYGVLKENGIALVMAVHPVLIAKLQKSKINQSYFSSYFGNETIKNFSDIQHPFLKEIIKFLKIKEHFTLTIENEYTSLSGIGSSASFVVAVVKCFLIFINQKKTDKEIFKIAKEIMRSVQGNGSGADIAASVYGGIIEYTKEAIKQIPYNNKYYFYAHSVGYKTKTSEMIEYVESLNPPLNLFQEMNKCTQKGIQYFRENNFIQFGKTLGEYHDLLIKLGVSDPNLEEIVSNFRKNPNILGSKISGSGKGDCVIGFSTKQIKEHIQLKTFFY